MTTPIKDRPLRPKFTGVDTFIDPKGRYHFRYASDWHRYELDGHPEGVIYSPYPNQEAPKTFVSGYVVPLEFEVVAEDMADLSVAVQEGLQQLEDLKIEQAADDAYGNMLKFDRTFTFREGDAVRKRHAWILYVGTWQIVLAYQGESIEDFEYWLPMGNTMFFHIKIPDELWFATDRDLNGFTKLYSKNNEKPEA